MKRIERITTDFFRLQDAGLKAEAQCSISVQIRSIRFIRFPIN